MKTPSAVRRTTPTLFAASWAFTLASCLLGLHAAAAEPGRTPAELFVLDPERLPRAEQTLTATLQGVLNESRATVWMRAQGMSAVVLDQLRREGVALHEEESPWPLVARFRDRIAGAIVYDAGSESLNVATSLCGPKHALAVEAGLPCLYRKIYGDGH